MKTSNLALTSALLAAVLATPSALAAPLIGFAAGNGITAGYSTYADLWTNVTNTGLATNFIPGHLVGPGANAPYLTELRSQMVIGIMTDSTLPGIVTPAGLNSSFELSKVVRFQERVDAQTATTAHFSLPPSQDIAMDVDPDRAGVQNMAIYFDDIRDGSVATPNGPGSVSCYGAGSTSAGCGVGGDGDGVMILSGHVVFNDASFTANGPVGTGSFDSRFQIDFVNPEYLDIVTGSIFQDQLTGTTNVPAFFTPQEMWDGAMPSSVPFLKVDSSQSFAAVPEPATLALLGIGCAALALNRRRTRS